MLLPVVPWSDVFLGFGLKPHDVTGLLFHPGSGTAQLWVRHKGRGDRPLAIGATNNIAAACYAGPRRATSTLTSSSSLASSMNRPAGFPGGVYLEPGFGIPRQCSCLRFHVSHFVFSKDVEKEPGIRDKHFRDAQGWPLPYSP